MQQSNEGDVDDSADDEEFLKSLFRVRKKKQKKLDEATDSTEIETSLSKIAMMIDKLERSSEHSRTRSVKDKEKRDARAKRLNATSTNYRPEDKRFADNLLEQIITWKNSFKYEDEKVDPVKEGEFSKICQELHDRLQSFQRETDRQVFAELILRKLVLHELESNDFYVFDFLTNFCDDVRLQISLDDNFKQMIKTLISYIEKNRKFDIPMIRVLTILAGIDPSVSELIWKVFEEKFMEKLKGSKHQLRILLSIYKALEEFTRNSAKVISELKAQTIMDKTFVTWVLECLLKLDDSLNSEEEEEKTAITFCPSTRFRRAKHALSRTSFNIGFSFLPFLNLSKYTRTISTKLVTILFGTTEIISSSGTHDSLAPINRQSEETSNGLSQIF